MSVDSRGCRQRLPHSILAIEGPHAACIGHGYGALPRNFRCHLPGRRAKLVSSIKAEMEAELGADLASSSHSRSFSTVWSWVNRWFDPGTVEKIFILSCVALFCLFALR